MYGCTFVCMYVCVHVFMFVISGRCGFCCEHILCVVHFMQLVSVPTRIRFCVSAHSLFVSLVHAARIARAAVCFQLLILLRAFSICFASGSRMV